MNGPARLLWMVLICVAAVVLWRDGGAHVSAQRRVASAEKRLQLALRQAQELQDLRAQIPACLLAVGTGSKSTSPGDSSLSGRIHQVLAHVGLPETTLITLAPQGATVIGASRSGRSSIQRLRDGLTLEPITLPELGDFLVRLGDSTPCSWIASIHLVVDSKNNARLDSAPSVDTPRTDTPRPLRAMLTIEHLAIAPDRGER